MGLRSTAPLGPLLPICRAHAWGAHQSFAFRSQMRLKVASRTHQTILWSRLWSWNAPLRRLYNGESDAYGHFRASQCGSKLALDLRGIMKAQGLCSSALLAPFHHVFFTALLRCLPLFYEKPHEGTVGVLDA